MNKIPQLAYRPEEAAKMLGVSRSRFYTLINDGTLKTYRDGKRRLCSHAALVECQAAMERASSQGRAVA